MEFVNQPAEVLAQKRLAVRLSQVGEDDALLAYVVRKVGALSAASSATGSSSTASSAATSSSLTASAKSLAPPATSFLGYVSQLRQLQGGAAADPSRRLLSAADRYVTANLSAVMNAVASAYACLCVCFGM